MCAAGGCGSLIWKLRRLLFLIESVALSGSSEVSSLSSSTVCYWLVKNLGLLKPTEEDADSDTQSVSTSFHLYSFCHCGCLKQQKCLHILCLKEADKEEACEGEVGHKRHSVI